MHEHLDSQLWHISAARRCVAVLLSLLCPSLPSHKVLMLRDSPSKLEGESRTVSTSYEAILLLQVEKWAMDQGVGEVLLMDPALDGVDQWWWHR